MTPAHHEGGERSWCVQVTGFRGTDALEAIEVVRVDVEGTGTDRTVTPRPGTAASVPCNPALIAIGFEGVAPHPLLDGLGASLTEAGTRTPDVAPARAGRCWSLPAAPSPARPSSSPRSPMDGALRSRAIGCCARARVLEPRRPRFGRGIGRRADARS